MAKKIDQKKQVINKYKSNISSSKAVFFFSGSLNASNTVDIKNFLGKEAKLTLLKNSLFNIACKDSNLDLKLDGYNNAVFVEDKIIENANSLAKFISDNEFHFNQVLIGTTLYEGAKVKEIAKLGSNEQVYGKLVGIISAPTTLLVRSLQSPLQKLAYVLSQIQPKS